MKANNIRNAASAFFMLTVPVIAFAQPTVWTTSSLVRTGKSAAAGSGTQATLSAARGEYESFQIAVRGSLTNVNVSVTDLSGPGGAIIAKANIALFREQYVYVSQSSPNWDGSNQPLGAGWYPDALIPFNDPSTGQPLHGAQIQAVPFNLDAATNQPIWVDIFVPRTAAAGLYTGGYTVSSDQGSVTGNIALTVWNFTLPPQASLKSAFLVYNDTSLASDQELLRNRVSPLHTDPANQSGLMSSFGLDLVGLPYFSGANFSNCTMGPPPSVSELLSLLATQQPGLMPLIYSADETNDCPGLIPIIKDWGRNLHQAGIRNLVTMAPNSALFDDGNGTGRSAVDIWSVLPVGYDQSPSLNAAVLAKGDSIWSYNTLVQDAYSPKWEIDFSPINFRIQPGFISQSLGISGMLYWKVDSWSPDPWNQVNNTGAYSSGNYPGEGMLVYPGYQVGIAGFAPSMRLKWVRDGVEDFEYVQMLKLAGQGSFALQQAAAAGPDWTNWTRDPNVIFSVRQHLAQQLDQQTTAPASTPAPVAPAAPVAPTGGANCANSLVANFVEPSVWAVLQAGTAQRIQAKITDNCGTPVASPNGGSAVVSFSSGESAVTLQDWGNGIWTGMWTPSTSNAQITLTAAGTQGNASGNGQLTVTVQSASHVTAVATVVSAAAGAQAAPGVVTPGGYVSIYGSNLAGGGNPVAASTPLPTTLNGTQVFLGSTPLALVYAGVNQINGVIPQGYNPGSPYSLVVVNGGNSSAPVSVSIAGVQPAIYSADASGSGQGVIYVAGTSSRASSFGAGARPALAGEYLTIYCTGLGAVSGPNGETAPPAGTAAPTSPALKTTGEITVAIGGVHQTAQFAGLAPGMVGVYQVNVLVPPGLSGDDVPVTITMIDPQNGGFAQSNTVTVALR